MTRFLLQKTRPIRNVSFALSVGMLSILCLSSSALAQAPGSKAAPAAESPATNNCMWPAVCFQVGDSVSSTTDHSLTFGERVDIYRRSVLSPEAIVGPAFGAAIGQWEDEPSRWGQGGEGYGKRFASGLARHEIGETISFGFAAVDGEDPRYFLSQNPAFWARTQHAVLSTFVSHTSSGRTIPAFSRFAGTYGAAFISNTWYPHNRAGAGDAARRGSTALASSVGFNLVREFLPFFRRNAH